MGQINMLKSTLLLIACFTLHICFVACGVHIFVNPHGSDHNDGHSDKVPVQTIYKALSLAGQSKYNNQSVYIELMQGHYDLYRTLVITRKNTIIRSYNHQEVHVTGGHRIPSTVVKPVTDRAILSRLPAKAHAHVRVVNLRDLNITDFGQMDEYGSNAHRHSPLEVFYNGQPLHLARWPDDGYLDIANVLDGRNGLRFRYNSTVPQSWHNESDPWAYGYWYYGWADRAVKIKSLDLAIKTVTLVHKTPRGLRTGHLQEYLHGVSNKEGGYFRFLNILGALDQPGEYYMDRANGKLYFWLPNHDGSAKATDVIYISMINDCIQIKSHTQNVQLLDFTLEVCRRSGIYAPNAKKVKIGSLQIRNTGGSAASFTGDSRESEISRCYIHNTCGGIWMYGGNRQRLESSGNTIINNEISRFSRVGVVGNYAVTLVGVGHTVKDNHIYDGGHGAIQFLGNDMTVEHNLIHHVCTDAALCGAVKTSNDWTFRGNTIQYNIIHHILRLVPGVTCKAVLLDGQASGTSIMFNSFYNNTVDILIAGGRYNKVVNNVMYNAEVRSIEVDGRGIGHYSTDLHKKLDAMPYKSSEWSLRYPQLANIDRQNASLPLGNQISRNVMYARPHTEYIHGLTGFLAKNTPRYFNISQTIFSSGSHDHFSIENGDLRVRCSVSDRANRVNFKQPPSPNAVGPTCSKLGPLYLNRGRLHLVNTTYPYKPCTTQAPQKESPQGSYLPDGSPNNHLYPVENTGCWLNVTKCRHHPAAIGTYRDMYGERYRNADVNETMCFRRAFEQWQFCGSHNDEVVAVIYGPTGGATLGGNGCMTATFGCPKHGGPVGIHNKSMLGKYYHDSNGERTHTEQGCLSHAWNIWHYCGSSPRFPITNVYLPTGAKRTAGGGCWITVEHCPTHTDTKRVFYDAFGSTNFQTDDSEFACHHQAEYYWNYCGSNAKYPVTATYRPKITSKTYP